MRRQPLAVLYTKTLHPFAALIRRILCFASALECFARYRRMVCSGRRTSQGLVLRLHFSGPVSRSILLLLSCGALIDSPLSCLITRNQNEHQSTPGE